jgi:predicted transposase/invertase (TIGR01784 family)
MFKYVLANEQYIDTSLIPFLSHHTKLKPEELKGLSILTPFTIKKYIDDKQGILDLKTRLPSGEIVIIEMQASKTMDNFAKRFAFYADETYVHQIKSGEPYTRLNRVIAIAVADFNLFPKSTAYIHHFRVVDDDHFRWDDYPKELYIILPRNAPPSDDWGKLLNAKTKGEFLMLKSSSALGISQTARIVEEANDSEEFQEYSRALERHKRDVATQLEETRQEEKRSTALRFLRNTSLSSAEIAKSTELSTSEVEELKKQI